ncbi:adenosine deaminase family protein [Legionella jordanis]|uniref:adenosine deaminase n=1 Tax=Legionella jordanis TaxID=456 RepID=A0A0W0VB42_9GAMM|nr:adenosine deaminase [Legionella jordanis]KTD17346.1 adenosine deaminase [Legionella jordanis]RMX01886.1 adenosine deaminase [Legionella jordanis]RMX17676.1 adenosine deaminase [Legionella jordanis]VEH11637.1 adenosine deaminase [Legionella jordanis]
MHFFKILALSVGVCWNLLAFASVDQYFNAIKTEPNALYAFLKKMPKGGELHYHLAGGAYPEHMLAIAAREHYCLDKQTLAVSKIIEHCNGLEVKEIAQYQQIYDKTIAAWSMKNFIAGAESSHDHFFNTFDKFIPIVTAYSPELLAEVMQRAAAQHEQYLEIMILPDDAHSISFGTPDLLSKNFATAKNELLANKDFQRNIDFSIKEAQALLQKARKNLGCDNDNRQGACQLTVKFQYYILREQPLEKVFAQALTAFAAAARSTDIVGINLVQAEDGFISLRDYRKQMSIINFLHHAYPSVHISLHAGELNQELVAPWDLNFHIQEAINQGHAERVGHGTAIAFEENAEELLKKMAEHAIAVEINLTSNRKILNVYGQNHPLSYYLKHQVPVVLSTDDEGVLRTDLTREYQIAVLEHHVDYPTLKQISRNALTYSFLPGKSLWAQPSQAKLVPECQDLDSSSCKQFLAQNAKAKLQWQLEQQFHQFEAQY